MAGSWVGLYQAQEQGFGGADIVVYDREQVTSRHVRGRLETEKQGETQREKQSTENAKKTAASAFLHENSLIASLSVGMSENVAILRKQYIFLSPTTITSTSSF